MEKDRRYAVIRPMFTRGRIQTFNDIFKQVPKTIVARDLGKDNNRFTELIDSPGDFTIEEIIELDSLCQLELTQMAVLLEPECKRYEIENTESKDSRYKSIRPMFEEGQIRLFEDIFYVPKSTVATDIDKKRERFYYLMDHVEEFLVKDIFRIGQLCELTLPEMFQLVEAQYKKQTKPKK